MTQNLSKEQFNQNLIEFLNQSPTPFHAVSELKNRLESSGFKPLLESDAWELTAGGRYYVTRNDSSIVAFVNGMRDPIATGVRIVGAHTDSPNLQVKPQPETSKKGYFQLGVEVYGGALLATWFDRDLSLAGRVTFRNASGLLGSKLIDFKRPIATVASLAIHLDRTQNESRTINQQTDIPPILGQLALDEKKDFRDILKHQILNQYPDLDVDEVLDFEMSFYDTQSAAVIGLNNEFLAGARLDNLLSCFVGLQALLRSDGQQSAVLVCNDHEEVGSTSTSGADGPLLQQVLRRWANSHDNYCRMVENSMLVSADNAHGVHPNYVSWHEANHGPILNKGPVIKINANQRYASNSATQAIFRNLCQKFNTPVQDFVTRTDLGCGSTIGPITAAGIGIRTLDIGLPTFGMHSIRELAGTSDAYNTIDVLAGFYELIDVSSAESSK